VYVCICNAITDGDIRRAATVDGARRTAEVYAACHCRAQCGACVRRLRELMLQSIAAADHPPPP
jgi:bacterioferritin-associated ferredoxin